MLTKRIFQSLSTILIVCFASACAAPVALADLKCADRAGNKRAQLTIAEYQLGLDTKKTFCVEIGKTYNIPIKIPGYSKYKVEAGDVTVEQKPGSPLIITGNNLDNPKYLKIMARYFDKDAGDDKDCGDESDDECAKFWIKVRGVGELDPRVRVVDSNFAINNLQNALAITLDDLGLTADEATMLLKTTGDGE